MQGVLLQMGYLEELSKSFKKVNFFSFGTYVIRMSLVCTPMASVCHWYVLVCHPYVTHMYSHSSACHSYVLVCHPYVTRMWFYHEPVCTSTFHSNNTSLVWIIATKPQHETLVTRFYISNLIFLILGKKKVWIL